MSETKSLKDIHHFRQMMKKDFLGYGDLAGKEIAVTIADIIEKMVRNPETKVEDPRWVVMFKGASKGFILNNTNLEKIAAIHGDDPNGWVGQQVILWEDPSVMAFGKKCGGIRIKHPKAKSAAAKEEDMRKARVKEAAERGVENQRNQE